MAIRTQAVTDLILIFPINMWFIIMLLTIQEDLDHMTELISTELKVFLAHMHNYLRKEHGIA